MSSDPLIRAALLWDVPALRASGDADAEALIDAFGPPPFHEQVTESSPLASAARGVRAERTGDLAGAVETWAEIVGSGWIALLRLSLRAWSQGVPGVEDIEEAVRLLAGLDADAVARTHLLLKFAGFAYDKAAPKLFRELVAEAAISAPANSRVAIVAAIRHANATGEFREWGDVRSSEPDPLITRDWIDALALDGAQSFVSDLMTDRARGPWSSTLRMGRQPVDHVVAAEVQATWAGDFQQRQQIRKQLAAQVLLDPIDGAQAIQSLFYWFDAGGGNHQDVCAVVEPLVTAQEADWLVRAIGSRPPRPTIGDDLLTKVGLAFWDCVSEGVLRGLVSHVESGLIADPYADAARRLWRESSRRLPVLLSRFGELPEVAQIALAGELAPEQLRSMGEADARRLLTLMEDAPAASPGLWTARAVLGDVVGAGIGAAGDLSEAGPYAVTEVFAIAPALVPDEVRRSAIAQLVAELGKMRADAREGRHAIGGGPGPGSAISRLPVASDEISSVVEALLGAASDELLDGQTRLETLLGVATIAHDHGLGAAGEASVRNTPIGRVRGDLFALISIDDLNAARLVALSSRLANDDELEIFASSRSSSARARLFAANAAVFGVQRNPDSERLQQVLVGGLFDPDEGVVVESIRGLAQDALRSSSLAGVVERRMESLLETRRRRVRIAVARFARSGPAVPARLVEQIAQDKSWAVREAFRDSEDN